MLVPSVQVLVDVAPCLELPAFASRLPLATCLARMLSLAKCDSFMWQFVCLFAFGSLWPVGLSVVAS